MNKREGIFISFDGPDGAGKGTQIKLLKDYLEKLKMESVFTREPGGTFVSEKIRNIILDPENDMSDETEAFLYASSRCDHVNRVIKPALEEGKVIVSDRYIDASLVYQGYARGLGFDLVYDINKNAIKGIFPDKTFFVLTDSKTSFARRKNASELDRIELEGEEFQKKVITGFQLLVDKFPDRIVLIDGGRSIEEVHSDIKMHVNKLIKIKRPELFKELTLSIT